MKILSKKSVDSEVANQRKTQIDEGLSIAKRVDTLRQTLASLEQQHKKFLEGMSLELSKNTDHLFSKIASLKLEIEGLEEKRNALLKPLNEEWERVTLKSKEILQREEDVLQKNSNLEFREKNTEEREKKSKDSLFRIKTRERELVKCLEDAYKFREDLEQLQKEAESKKSSIEKEFVDRENSIKGIEAKNMEEARANEHFHTILSDKEKELRDRERQINDKYQTLLRTQERLKK